MKETKRMKTKLAMKEKPVAPAKAPAVKTASKGKGQLLYRIERYYEANPEKPEGMQRAVNRFTTLARDIEEWGIKTIILDSATAFEMQGRFYSQFVTMKDTKDPRRWFADSADWVERMVMVRFPSLAGRFNINAIVIAHTAADKDKDGNTLKHCPDMPGRCATRPGAFYTEIYYVEKDSDGSPRFIVESDKYTCMTQIGVPNKAPASYPTVAKQLVKVPMDDFILCTMLHGRYGQGKTTAAASWPTPSLVLHFDSPGKDLPYVLKGSKAMNVNTGSLIPTLDVYK